MITCSVCGKSKTEYNFFLYINLYDKTFFAAGLPQRSDVCWSCAGDYKCIQCGDVKDHTHFRIMGRVCDACKNPTIPELYTYKVGGIEPLADVGSLDSENALNNTATS